MITKVLFVREQTFPLAKKPHPIRIRIHRTNFGFVALMADHRVVGDIIAAAWRRLHPHSIILPKGDRIARPVRIGAADLCKPQRTVGRVAQGNGRTAPIGQMHRDIQARHGKLVGLGREGEPQLIQCGVKQRNWFSVPRGNRDGINQFSLIKALAEPDRFPCLKITAQHPVAAGKLCLSIRAFFQLGSVGDVFRRGLGKLRGNRSVLIGK